ncbi:MAG: glucosylceramidase [Treponema sp.]|jgi:glucosylceramidase|nr:glucosylceramidase [Treponema sp.]
MSMTRLELMTTSFPGGKKKQGRQWAALVDDDGEENEVINLYPRREYQVFEGAGGAFTDAAGYVFSLMDEGTRKKLIEAYFGPGGAGYTLGRVHLDSCDFSRNHYEAMPDSADRGLSSFSLARDESSIFPLLRAAEQTLGGPIPLMTTFWSPPAFMKDTGKRNGGGKLLESYRAFFADYYCRYLLELRRAGFTPRRLTAQNEPKAVQTWDSCVYSAEEEMTFIRDFLYPALKGHHLEDMEIFIWDHNKERAYERALAAGEAGILPLLKGVAVHWYSGDHFEVLKLLGETFPALKIVQSEFSYELKYASMADMKNTDVLLAAERYAHDIIGNLNHGMTAFYDWNLVLDEQGGPNHAGNYCDAPFIYHPGSGALEERPIYSYIAHVSRHIRPGAKRIALSRYADNPECTAFRDPRGGLVLVMLNRTERALPVSLRIEGKLAGFLLPPRSIATGLLGAP